jgi:hypothetical protein
VERRLAEIDHRDVHSLSHMSPMGGVLH